MKKQNASERFVAAKRLAKELKRSLLRKARAFQAHVAKELEATKDAFALASSPGHLSQHIVMREPKARYSPEAQALKKVKAELKRNMRRAKRGQL